MIGEYLSILPQIWSNREKIIEGVVNRVKNKFHILPEDEQEEIIRRQLICAQCSYMSDNAKKEGYETERIDSFCIMCNCNIELKTSSLQSECGIATYNLQNPDKQLPLKWTIYKKDN